MTGQLRLLKQALQDSNFITIGDLWDYSQSDFIPPEEVVAGTTEECSRLGVTTTQMWNLVYTIMDKLVEAGITTQLRQLREDAGDQPQVKQIWGSVDRDIMGRVQAIDTTLGCDEHCNGDLLTLDTFPTKGGYGPIADVEGVSVEVHCSCTMGLAVTSATHCYGMVQTAFCRFPELVGTNGITIESPVKEIRRAMWMTKYSEKERAFNAATRWDVMVGSTIPADRWARLFKAINRARVAGQVRSLLWKISMRCLPLLGYSHWQSWLGMSGKCVLCDGSDDESYTHLFCTCPATQDIWNGAGELLTSMRLPAHWTYSDPAKLIGYISPSATYVAGWCTDEAPAAATITAFKLGVWTEVRGQILNTIWLTRNKLRHDPDFLPPSIPIYLQNKWWHQAHLLAISNLYPHKDIMPEQTGNQRVFLNACWRPASTLVLAKLNLSSLFPP